MAGGVAPDEPLHQLLGGDVQRVPGNVLDRQDHLSIPRPQVHVHPGPRHSVLADVAEQIVQHPPQQTPVRQGHQVALVGVDDYLQLPGGQLLVVVPYGLVDDLIDHDGLQLHGNVAGGRFAGLHQVLGQLLQPVGLAVQHRYIFPGGGRQLLFFQ